ncbi:MAG: amino acid permease [Myxococcota bacterium]
MRNPPGGPESKGSRRLGLPSAVALVVANMIGAGVFTTSGFALADLGRPEPVLLAWGIGGLLAMCGALSYGALARRIPESGGEYTFLSRTVHPLAGFLAGWVSLLAGFTAPIAAAGLALQAYLAEPVRAFARPEWIGTFAIVAAGIMHGLRLREGVVLQNLAVGLKLILIVAFVGVGLTLKPLEIDVGALGTGGFELGAFAVTLVWISFAYSGWNAAVYLAGEIRNPERNLQRSLWMATALVTVIYLALNAVFLYSAPVSQLAGRADIGAVAARALGGPRLSGAVSGLIGIALFTSISSMVMVGPRVYAKMADEGFLPKFFSRGRDVPATAVALQVALSLLVLWMSDLAQLLGYIGFTLGLSAAATVGGLIVLRRAEGPERVPIPGYPWVPGLFVSATLCVALFMAVREPLQAGLGLGTVLLGIPFYWLARRARLSSPSRTPRG